MKVITVTFHLKEQLHDVLKENLYEKQNCWKEMMIGTNIGLIIEFNETPPLSAKTPAFDLKHTPNIALAIWHM